MHIGKQTLNQYSQYTTQVIFRALDETVFLILLYICINNNSVFHDITYSCFARVTISGRQTLVLWHELYHATSLVFCVWIMSLYLIWALNKVTDHEIWHQRNERVSGTLVYQMGYESIAHEAEGRTGYWLRAHEGERNNCFSKIQLVGQKNIETKHLSLVKARL